MESLLKELKKYDKNVLVIRDIFFDHHDKSVGSDSITDIMSVGELITIMPRYIGPKSIQGRTYISVVKSPCYGCMGMGDGSCHSCGTAILNEPPAFNSGAYMDIRDYDTHKEWAMDANNHKDIWVGYLPK